jgi:hypothetical protein
VLAVNFAIAATSQRARVENKNIRAFAVVFSCDEIPRLSIGHTLLFEFRMNTFVLKLRCCRAKDIDKAFQK